MSEVETYEIVEGVRRAYTAMVAGRDRIDCTIERPNELDVLGTVLLSQLRSRKLEIEVGGHAGPSRYAELLKRWQAGLPVDPIIVRPGAAGIPLDQIRIVP